MSDRTTPVDAHVALRVAGLITCAASALPVAFALPRLGWAGAAALAPYAVFAAAFLAATTESRSLRSQRLLLALQAAAAIGAAFAAPHSAVLVLLVVLAAQLPAAFPLVPAALGVAGLTGLAALSFRSEPPLFVAVTVCVYLGFEGFAMFMTLIAERERRARAELAATLLELESAREILDDRTRHAERERLTADLHDLIGHDLVALRVHLEAARRLPGGSAGEHLATASETAARLLDDVRALVRERRTGDVIDLGASLAPLRAGLPGLRIDLDIPDEFVVDDQDAAEAALRCAQESVTNAVRHARARRLWLAVRRDGSRLIVEARDDGQGGDASGEGGGLRGMRERAARLGGSLTTGAREGGGFSLRLEIPLRGTAA